jgi:hypothetical protein
LSITWPDVPAGIDPDDRRWRRRGVDLSAIRGMTAFLLSLVLSAGRLCHATTDAGLHANDLTFI